MSAESHEEWLRNIETLRARFPEGAVFYVGHGGPVGPEMWDWQREYIERFVGAVSGADWSNPDQAKAAVVGGMKAYEPSEELQILDGAEHRANRGQARAADPVCLRMDRQPEGMRALVLRSGRRSGALRPACRRHGPEPDPAR